MAHRVRREPVARQQAFSLLELSIVIAIVSLMIGFVLQATLASNINNGECALETRAKLNYINTMLLRYARANDKLPLPAPRNVGVEDPMFGRSAAAPWIDQIGSGATGVSFGALPFSTLGLNESYAGDCWGNKFSYAVTTDLTSNASTSGYLDDTVLGNMTIRNSASVSANDKIAYAVISHGPDELGAVKMNYAAANAGGTPDSAHGWCSGADLQYLNCNATAAVVADGVYNDGRDAGANYFDDIVIAAEKPKMLADAQAPLHSWGFNDYGQRGNNGIFSTDFPTLVALPAGVTSFTSLEAGRYSTCGIANNSIAYCWGRNNNGQLGDSTYVAKALPSPVTITPAMTAAGFTHFVTIKPRGLYACGLGNNALVYCWGRNSHGQLGDNTTTTRNYPEPLFNMGLTYSAVSAGGGGDPGGNYHACAIATTGQLYCWGANNYGQLGNNGATGTSLTPSAVTTTAAMTASGFTHFTQISAGFYGNCGLDNNGKAWCWGYNGTAILGDGTSDGSGSTSFDKNVPTAVAITPAMTAAGHTHFLQISSKHSNACAIDNTHTLYCWGSNNMGSLGNGDTVATYSNVPVPVSITPAMAADGVTSFNSVETGNQFNCAIANNNKAYCWGWNTSNKGLGDGGATQYSYTPVPVSVTAAMAAAGDILFSRISVAADTSSGHGCLLSSLNRPYCWGQNDYNQLGADYSTVPTQDVVLPTNVTSFSQVTGGMQHSCALGNDNLPYCWGGAGYHQLGNGSTTMRLSAAPVTLPVGVTKFTRIDTGYVHSCGLADDALVYCWGYNGMGQIGDGTLVTKPLPTAVTLPFGVTSFTSLVVGAYHTCATGNDQALYCWGQGISGQIGDGNNSNRSVPTKVTMPMGVTKFSNLTSTGSHTCGFGDDGKAYCWGSNSPGQLGDGTGVNKNIPTLINMSALPGVTFTKLVAGWDTTCGAGSNGLAYCWGSNNYGQLGDGTTTWRSVPTQVNMSAFPGVRLTNFGLGQNFTCATGNDGKLYCFGINERGQLGDASMNSYTTPHLAVMPPGVKFTQLNAGYNHIFAW